MINQLKKMLRLDATPKQVRTDGWSNILTGLGIRGRDKNASTVFRTCPTFNFIELDQLYRGDGLTRRIIDIVPNEMTRQGWEIEGDSEFLISSQMDSLNAVPKITQLLQYARLYGGSIIVMGIADGRELDEPVNEANIQDVKWLHIFDRWQTTINPACMCQDLNSPNYGYPDWYEVYDNVTFTSFRVHYSRVLRVDWNLVAPRLRQFNQGWGDSVVLSIYEEIKNNGTAIANTGLIIQDFVNGVFKIPNLSEVFASACGEENLKRRLDWANLSKSTTNMMIMDSNEDYQKLSTNVSGLDSLLEKAMLNVCSVTGIPATLLFGRSPAGMNATGDADIRNFYDMVKQYQEFKLKPILEKLVKYLMLARLGPFLGKEIENWNIKFVPLWQNTEEQEVLLKKLTAETDAIYIDRGVVDSTEIAISRFGGDRYSPVTVIDIEARENGFNQEEINQLEAEKAINEELEGPEATVGPDNLPGDNNRTVIYTDED